MKKVFLGGTCNGSKWRESLIPLLEINYFDPVVDEWTDAVQEEEKHQREVCDYCLYVITPKMEGAYSIAEVVDDSNKRPEKTIFCFLEKDEETSFSDYQIISLQAVRELVKKNRAIVCNSIQEVAHLLNSKS